MLSVCWCWIVVLVGRSGMDGRDVFRCTDIRDGGNSIKFEV